MQDSFYEDPQEIGHALATAQERLASFEHDVLNRNAMLRLRSARPFHPTLILRFLAVAMGCLGLLLAVSLAAAPLLDAGLARQLADLQGGNDLDLPVAVGLLAAGCFLFGVCAHLAALVFARNAPLLPHEARNHQRLVSDVKRLEAQMAVSARLTPPPAGRRVHL